MRKIYTLSEKEVDGAISLPIIKTNFIQSKYDFKFNATIFTSKNGVIGFDKICSDWRNYPSFAIGAETSSQVEKFSGKLLMVGKNSYGDNFANEIASSYSNLSFVWPRAKIIAFDIAAKLKSKKICINEIIVYETICNDIALDHIKSGDIIIFSSPSTVKCFFERFDTLYNVLSVAIGKTTAKELERFNIACQISPIPSLKEAVAFASLL